MSSITAPSRPRRLAKVTAAVIALAVLTACHPIYTGAQFRDLQNRFDYPRTRPTTASPSVRGHAGADARIHRIAEQRGYRLRPVHVGSRRTVAGVALDTEAANALNGLIADARRAGHVLQADSGFRDVPRQRTHFLGRIASASNAAIASGRADATIDAALRWVAAPGYSKHHTGFAVDLRSPHGAAGAFASTPVGRWLAADNHRAAKNRGFVPSYPAGAGAQGPDPEPWEYVYVGTDAIRCGMWLVRHGDRFSFDACRDDSPIPPKYEQLGGRSGQLGPTTARESRIGGARPGRAQRYRGGLILWSRETGAHPLWGRLTPAFDRSGGTRGPLGYPTTDIRTTKDGRARYSIFQGGRIYGVAGQTDAFHITKPFSDLHQAHGGILGDLGHVLSSPKAVSGGTVQEFERGRIYESVAGRFAVWGPIHDLHRSTGGSMGTLGFPIGGVGAAGGGVRVQRFQHGTVEWDVATGTATIRSETPPEPDEEQGPVEEQEPETVEDES